jgi:hypothetical protein
MTDATDNLMLERLRSLSCEPRELRDEQREQHVRLASIERSHAHVELIQFDHESDSPHP